MTVDERVLDLMAHLPYTTKSGGVVQFRERLRLALLETTKDQRHACTEAIMAVTGDSDNPWLIDKDAAHLAVMNSEI